MLKKKLMSLGIAVVFTLSSLTTTVFAADFNKATTGATVTVKFTNPGKGNGQDKDKKNDDKKSHQDWYWCGKISKGEEKKFNKSVSWKGGHTSGSSCNGIETHRG